ncbi:hypothetical protein [uncultured Pseudokineococcus sp.]|uniref:helix-turn-helix domain-containing protein n=1 Tax=uncultured Pseudokineococcus sp. TaxID=1642928 RepID=UPI002628CD8B|nr:hypothetical protein [uncultured Pseudokineococcus sp.]
MTRQGSALIPLMRDSQARLLAAVLLHPNREASIADLAREVGADAGNLHGDVEKLVEAGIFRDRRVGRSRLVAPGDNPVNGPLAELVAVAYGPKALVEDALSGVDGLEEAFLVGSWAARYLGEPGRSPDDVDVVVVGDVDRDDAHERVEALVPRLRRPVQVVFRTRAAWERADDAFSRDVQRRPHVRLDVGRQPQPTEPTA